MATARNALLQRPQWVIANTLTMPLVTVADDGKKRSVAGLVSVIIPFTIFLDTLFMEKVATGRSMESDQFHLFKSLEGALQVAGMNGKACLLRTICEIQQSDLGRTTFAGEIVTLLLTPKRGEGGFSGFLKDYLEAERAGQAFNQSCADSFPRCPMSLFDFFSSYSSGTQRPAAKASYPEFPPSNTEGSMQTINMLSNNDLVSPSLIQNDYTSVRAKHPFGLENTLY